MHYARYSCHSTFLVLKQISTLRSNCINSDKNGNQSTNLYAQLAQAQDLGNSASAIQSHLSLPGKSPVPAPDKFGASHCPCLKSVVPLPMSWVQLCHTRLWIICLKFIFVYNNYYQQKFTKFTVTHMHSLFRTISLLVITSEA